MKIMKTLLNTSLLIFICLSMVSSCVLTRLSANKTYSYDEILPFIDKDLLCEKSYLYTDPDGNYFVDIDGRAIALTYSFTNEQEKNWKLLGSK